ncbi:transporter [Polynucleobacter paneuropaeus]|nr:transporter [Polynucleobacter paneuropaeus]
MKLVKLLHRHKQLGAIALKLMIVCLIAPLKAFGIDLQPNDIVAPLPDKNYLMLSYYDTENATFYKNGSAVTTKPYGNPVIDNQSAILRASHTYSISSLPAVSYVQLPYGTIRPAGSLSNYPTNTAIGDTTIATAIWPYSNRDTRTYLGIAAYLIVPTGSYNSTQPFNMGSNRYSSDVQMGFQKPIYENLDGMIAVDTQWFGGNSQCAALCGSISNIPLTQKPLTTTQLGPIYKINQIFTVAASYFYVAGGGTSINNVYQNNAINTQRFLISSLAYTDIGHFSLQYGRDMEIKNGFVQSRVLAVRYMKEF